MSDTNGISRKKRPPKLQLFHQDTNSSGDSEKSDTRTLIESAATGTSDSCNLDKSAVISIGRFNDILVSPETLEKPEYLGRGQYGIVEKVFHRPSKSFLAVKRVPLKPGDDNERNRLLMDVDVLVKGTECPNIIKFYGSFIWEGDLWILMELMDCSLDKFYKLAHSRQITPPNCIQAGSFQFNNNDAKANLNNSCPIPERVLGRVSADILNALSYLYTIKIIHRDIKPSNILINQLGIIKLCDFGISGYLVNSVARTYDAGCRPYMAPERIDPPRDRTGYDIKSDVWSFGITIVEIATGRYPYHHARGFFEQLKSICSDPPPKLPIQGGFSKMFEDFIDQCLQKDYQARPKFDTLLSHPFIEENRNVDIGDFAKIVLATNDCT